jgi:RHS repeat-associated protein
MLDAVSNTKNDGFRQYTYNALNQLSSLTAAGKTTQYSYDAQNRRILKTSGTSSTAYVYAEETGEGSTALSPTSLLGEYSSTNSKDNKEYIYLGDTPIAVVQTGNILTVQTDHLNTPRQLTDSTKKVVWNWAYSAFGENQPTSINATTTLNLRYPGQYYDAESKLHYNINRYYDPATGRYTQSDPIGLSGGINTYTYVGGNTVKYSDKTGLIKDLGSCLAACTANQLGILDVLSLAGLAATAPIIPKNIVTTGGTEFTSIFSKKFGSIGKMPINPFSGNHSWPAPTYANLGARTAKAGRFIGRWIPVVGVGLFAYDAIMIGVCTKQCMEDGCGK